jgi:uncharacterized membrane protein
VKRARPAPHKSPPQEATQAHDLARLTFLSDGVFAIALTLLALELKAPADWDGSAFGLLHQMRGSLTAFGVSFLVIAFYWITHRRSFRYIRHADGVLTGLNFVALGLITLVPFATRLLMERSSGTQAVGAYLGLIAVIGLANALLWGYAAVRPGIMEPEAIPRSRLAHFLIMLVAPATGATLSIMSSQPGWGWLWGVIAALWIGAAAFRRWEVRRPA